MAFDWTAFGRAIPGSRSATAADRLLPRGRHDLPRDVVARTQRDRLIDAMARTVALKGYPNTALGDVCAAAGVSTRAFYEHFPDKERCFLAAFESGVELLQRAVATAHSQPGRWPDRMRRGLATLLDILAAEPSFAALAVVEVMAAGPRALACRRALLSSYVQFFEEAPRRSGQPAVPRVAIEALIAGVYGVVFDHISTGETEKLPDRLPELTFVILAPFLGPKAAAATARFPV